MPGPGAKSLLLNDRLSGVMLSLWGFQRGTSSRGGRKEADVVGFKYEDNKLVIEHWEVSSIYRSSEYIVEAIMKKFSKDRVEAVVKYIHSVM